MLWNPPLLDVALGVRRSALAEASYVLAETVLGGRRAIAFAPTRKAAELIYGYVRRRLEDRDRAAAGAVMPYRAGYTPEQRREIERRLFDGELAPWSPPARSSSASTWASSTSRSSPGFRAP